MSIVWKYLTSSYELIWIGGHTADIHKTTLDHNTCSHNICWPPTVPNVIRKHAMLRKNLWCMCQSWTTFPAYTNTFHVEYTGGILLTSIVQNTVLDVFAQNLWGSNRGQHDGGGMGPASTNQPKQSKVIVQLRPDLLEHETDTVQIWLTYPNTCCSYLVTSLLKLILLLGNQQGHLDILQTAINEQNVHCDILVTSSNHAACP